MKKKRAETITRRRKGVSKYEKNDAMLNFFGYFAKRSHYRPEVPRGF